MKKTMTALLIASSLSIATSSAFAEGAFDKENFSANMAITSNYLFRGITLSNGDGAVSGGFDWGYNGFYAGTWASSIKAVEEESFELDYYAGYTGEIGGFAYSLDAIYYDYPGDEGSKGDLAYYEYGGSLAYSFDVDLAPTVGVSVMHSPDFFQETGSATAIESSLDLSLPMDIGLGFVYGNQDLDKKQQGIDGYDYYGVSLSKSFGIADVTVGYSDTDSDGDTFQTSKTDSFYITVGASM